MIIGFNGEDHEFDTDHVAVLMYPNCMMNGLFLDMGDDYAFISAWDDSEDFIAQAIANGAPQYELGEGTDVDFTSPPHCWVVRSLARLVISSAEELLN